MKNKLKYRLAAAAFALTFSLNAVQFSASAAEDPSADAAAPAQFTYRYIPKAGAFPEEDVCYYSDDYFRQDSREQNPHLAAMSMSLAFSSFQETSAEFVTELLGKLGYSDIRVDDMNGTPTRDTIGSAIAHKNADGQEIVAVAIRGSRYLNEWCATLTAGESGDIEGFSKPSEKMQQRIREYIADNKLENVKLWLTGYSRAGAVADLTGTAINQNPDAYSTKAEDLYVYTFETPQCSLDPTVYDNIYCYLNCNDVVSYVYPTSWGMHRNGRVIQIAPEKTLPAKRIIVSAPNPVLDAGEVPAGQFLSEFIDYITNALTREVYSGACDDAVANLMELFVTKTPDQWQPVIDYVKNDFISYAREQYSAQFMYLLTGEIVGGIFRHNSDKMYQQVTQDLISVAETVMAETNAPLTDTEWDTIKENLYPILRAVGPVLAADNLHKTGAAFGDGLPENYDDPDYDPQTDPDEPVLTLQQHIEEEVRKDREEAERIANMTDAERAVNDCLRAYSDGDEDGYAGTPNAHFNDMPADAESRSEEYIAAYKAYYAEIYQESYQGGEDRRLYEESMTDDERGYESGFELSFTSASLDFQKGEGHYKESYDDMPQSDDGDTVYSEEYIEGYRRGYAEGYEINYISFSEGTEDEKNKLPFYHTGTFLLNAGTILNEHFPQTNLAHVQALDSYYTDTPETVISAAAAENVKDGILTLENGEKWYKVSSFENEKDYLIAVTGENGTQMLLTLNSADSSTNVWNYNERRMGPSTSSRSGILSADSQNLRNLGGTLCTVKKLAMSDEIRWEYNGSVLSLTENGVVSYLKFDENTLTFTMTNDPEQASAAAIYTNGETLERCITGQPCAAHYVTENSGYAAPVFTVGIREIETDSITWFVDGKAQQTDALTFSADSLKNRPAGIHRVCCTVRGHDENDVHYLETSEEAVFVIAKGVLPDSVLTFSDIHEEYSLIGDAIETVLTKTGGYIPSLIVCSGDLSNGQTSTKEELLNEYAPRIKPYLGGLDAVFTGGNHDSGAGCAQLSREADLGADDSLNASGGVIFDSRSEAAAKNGTNSLAAKDIIVYSLNYDAVMQQKDGKSVCSYAAVLPELQAFLQKTAENYHGELIIISAHSGLHTLGRVPGSADPSQNPIREWAGDNAYNIDGSYALAEMLNRYAEICKMDILYLFGHDHSRREAEFIMTEGDTLISTKNFAEKTVGTVKLHFTYANAGYLSNVIGSADSAFSLITRDGYNYVYELLNTKDSSANRTEIRSLYHGVFAAPEQLRQMAAVDFAQKTGTAADAEITEKTKDSVTIALRDANGKTVDSYIVSAVTGIGTNEAGEEITLPQTGNTDPAAVYVTVLAVMLLTGGAVCCGRAFRRKESE